MHYGPGMNSHVTTRGGLLPVMLAIGSGMLAMGVALSALPLELQSRFACGTTMIGLIMGIQSVATVLSRPRARRMADRLGGRNTLLCGLLCTACSALAYSLALVPVLPPVMQQAMIVAGRLAMGLGEGLMVTGGGVWAVTKVGSARAGAAMSWVGLAIFAGLGLGTALGDEIEAHAGFGPLCLVALALPVAGMGLTLLLPASVPPRAGGQTGGPAGGIRWKHLIGHTWIWGLTLGLSAVGFAAISSFLVIFYAAQGWHGGGWALGAFGAGHVIARLVGSRHVDRDDVRPMVAAIMLAEALGLALIWLAPGPAWAVAGSFLTGLGFSLTYPLLALPVLRQAPPAAAGSAIGLFDVFFDIAAGVGAVLSGLLSGVAGPGSPFAMAMLAAVAGCVVMLARPQAMKGGGRGP
ncbi:major facilitator superfamily transporter [Komagataeibacter europaeus NBRC 3261]|uniref:Major facilitator superfamily transporter n=2 Tax=Komagataeibacter europaeus TaxID=33995 RepID=A0A0D6Q1R6_KOMEU|nr:major facilitator superfamily transporter [Komagataeibacter europaeus NBRC 3261]